MLDQPSRWEASQEDIDAGYRAFGAGSDARLAGTPRRDNPYLNDSFLGKRWVDGWYSVHCQWGADVRGRWKIRTLPPVNGGRRERMDARAVEDAIRRAALPEHDTESQNGWVDVRQEKVEVSQNGKAVSDRGGMEA